MKNILFILVIFINIYENMNAVKNGGEGEPSQKKGKIPAEKEIVELSSGTNSPNTDGEENARMIEPAAVDSISEFGKWANNFFATLQAPLRINPGNFVQNSPNEIFNPAEGGSQAKSLAEGKGSLATNNSSKQQSKIIKKPIIKVHTKPAEFEGLVQKLTGKDATFEEIQEIVKQQQSLKINKDNLDTDKNRQSKDKRQLIIDLESGQNSSNTDGERKPDRKGNPTIIDWEKLQMDALYPKRTNAHEKFVQSSPLENPSNFVPKGKEKFDQATQTQTPARELNLGVSSQSSNIFKKSKPIKAKHISPPKYNQTSAANFRDAVQNFTGMKAPIDDNQEIIHQQNPVEIYKFHPHALINDNQQITRQQNPSQIYNSQQQTLQHFPGQQKLKQQNFGQHSSAAGIGQSSADPNWQITEETNFPHPNQNMSQSEVEKLLISIKENLDELNLRKDNLKNNLIKLLNDEIQHANMNEKEKTKLNQTRNNWLDEKRAIEEKIQILYKEQELYKKFMQKYGKGRQN